MRARSADAREAIVAGLRSAELCADIASLRDLSGGCIHRVMEVNLADGESVIAKVNDASALKLFEEEVVSLRALQATEAVIVPCVLAVVTGGGCAALLITRIEPPVSNVGRNAEAMWRAFGEDLAALHLAPLPPELSHGYGFPIDNHIGSTPQPNASRDDWVAFNVEHRLEHQLRLALQRDLLTAEEAKHIDGIIARLDHILPRRPRPSLLHGDLWSGNALPTTDKGPAVDVSPGPESRATCAAIDPASYIGDALADIAMMQLFGGFPQVCFDTWSERFGINLAHEQAQSRLAAYQLYHLLNHVNIFGRDYASQAMGLARRLETSCLR
jgi:fructosamine-3-kinase